MVDFISVYDFLTSITNFFSFWQFIEMVDHHKEKLIHLLDLKLI